MGKGQSAFECTSERLGGTECEQADADERDHGWLSMMRLAIDNVPDLIWAKDLNDRYLLANQTICDKLLMCERPEAAIGQTDLYFAERERRSGWKHTFGEKCVNSDAVVKSKRSPGRFLEKGYVRDRFLVLDVHKAPLFDEKGKMIGTVGCARDVTQYLQAKAALRKSQIELETIFDNAPVMMVLVDKERRVRHANRAALQASGLSAEAIMGRQGGEALKCLHSLDDPEGCGFGPKCRTCVLRTTVIDTIQTGNAHHEIEAVLPRLQGSGPQELHLLVSTAPLGVRQQSMAVVCLQDITHRKQAEKFLRESAKRLRFLSSRLLDAQENEHQRISMEIHDDLGQDMAVLKMQVVDVAARLRKDQDGLKAACDNTLELVDRIIGKMRRLTRDLNPSVIEELKLTGTLKWMLRDFEQQTGIPTALEMMEIDTLLAHEKQVIIYRIFQEAFHNIRKHAGATRVDVAIRRSGASVVFEIRDDGRGFDSRENARRHVTERGLGLAAMDERARMLGGHLDIRTRRDAGTHIILAIPTTETEANR